MTQPIDHNPTGKRRNYLASYIERDGCWIYTGSINNKGYGTILGKAAHRYFYERLVGAIPAGLVLDHLCKVKSCVNPEHLEVVTHRENSHRRDDYHKSHCLHGHALTPENVRVSVNAKGHEMRSCKTCKILGQRRSAA